MRVLASVFLCIVLCFGPPALAQVPSCSGDCDEDGFVRIHELLRLVKAVLNLPCVIPEPEFCPIDPCLGLDTDDDGATSTNELIFAVNRLIEAVGYSLSGCP